MTLSTGSWNFNGNGYVGELIISSVDAQGNLSGTVYGQPIEGFWNEAAQEILFMRIISAINPSTLQIHTGYLYQLPRNPGLGANYTHHLTGYFEAFAGTGAVASRIRYGWHASQTIVG